MKSSQVVYLDNNATTELSQDVSSALMDLVLHNIYGNPSSSHIYGDRIKALVDTSRYGVAKSINANPQEIFFTSGGTEANNLALRGVYDPYFIDENKSKVVTSFGEHSSVFKTIDDLTAGRFCAMRIRPEGDLNLEDAERLITEETALVSIMLANNETGALFPVKQITELAHSKGALVHCDAVQAYGKLKIDVHDLGVDLLSISGHKAHAMPGVGALYARSGLVMRPSITGGGQESNLRSGTENYLGIVSLGVVANEISRRVSNPGPGLRDAFEAGILKRVPDVIINAKNVPRVPNTSSITFKGIHSLSMLSALAEEGIIASAGSACSSGSVKPSRVLNSMGLSKEDSLSTIRFSFSGLSSLTDATLAIEACVKVSKLLR